MPIPMRLRPAYKTASESSKLLKAIELAAGSNDQPCVNCKSFEFCRRNHQDCKAFRDWTVTGKFRSIDLTHLFRSIYVARDSE